MGFLAPLLPYLLPILGSFGASALFELFSDDKLNPKEKELLELQQKGQRGQFDREMQATQQLQREDATAKWQQMLTQLGMQNVQDVRAGKDKASEMNMQANIIGAQGGARMAAHPEMQQLASMMDSPASFRNILGLE